MPNAKRPIEPEKTEAELEADSAYNLKVLQLAAELKAAAAKREANDV